MNHLQQLEIINFQSWKYCLLEFHKGVNVILGSSDKGKSSIIRSVNWVCSNKPTGNSFRSNFTKKPTEVTLEMSNQTICRKKGNKVNIYNLNESPENLQALRTDIPDEVRSITKIEEVNLQAQHQNYFLLQDTPGQVAKRLNEIAGLEVMDRNLRSINESVREIKQDKKTTDETIENLKEKIESLSWLAPCNKSLLALESSVEQLDKIEDEISLEKDLLRRHQKIQTQIDELPSQEALPEIEEILNLESEVFKIEEELRILEKVQERRFKLDKKLKRISPLKNAKLPDSNKWRTGKNKLNNQIKTLSHLLEKHEQISKDLLETTINYEAAENNLTDFKRKVKVCPTCGQKWSLV